MIAASLESLGMAEGIKLPESCPKVAEMLIATRRGKVLGARGREAGGRRGH